MFPQLLGSQNDMATIRLGDKNGMVGYGTGKSIEVTIANRKPLKDAINNLV